MAPACFCRTRSIPARTPGADHALAGRSMRALCRRHRHFDLDCDAGGILGGAERAVGRISRFCSLDRGHSDRSAGIHRAAGRRTSHQAHRECGQRRHRTLHHPLAIHSRPVCDQHSVRGQHQSLQCPPGHLGTPGRDGVRPSAGRRHAQIVAAHLQHHGSAVDRPDLGQARSLRAARPGRLGDEAGLAGRSRRGACDRVWRRGAADPDSAGFAAHDLLWVDPDRPGECRPTSTRLAWRRLHRPCASTGAAADPGSGAGPVGNCQRGSHGALRHSDHDRRYRHRDPGARPEIRRRAGPGKTRSPSLIGEPIWRQHFGRHPRSGSGAGAIGTDAQS